MTRLVAGLIFRRRKKGLTSAMCALTIHESVVPGNSVCTLFLTDNHYKIGRERLRLSLQSRSVCRGSGCRVDLASIHVTHEHALIGPLLACRFGCKPLHS